PSERLDVPARSCSVAPRTVHTARVPTKKDTKEAKDTKEPAPLLSSDRGRGGAHALRRHAHRLDNARVGAAAADVAIHQPRDVGLGGIRVGLEQADGRHHHARRAVAALEGLGVEERLLHRVQPLAVGQRFDRRDRLLPDAPDPRDAGAGPGAIEQHRARAALPFAAAVAAAGQAEIVAEDGEEAVARLGVNLAILAIDAQDISSHTGDFNRAQRLRPERGGGANRRAAPAPSESERGWGPASIEKCRREAARAYDAATQRRN